MKKFLAIVVLSLMVVSNAFAGMNVMVKMLPAVPQGDGYIGRYTTGYGGTTSVGTSWVGEFKTTLAKGQINYGHIYMHTLAATFCVGLWTTDGDLVCSFSVTHTGDSLTWVTVALDQEYDLIEDSYIIMVRCSTYGYKSIPLVNIANKVESTTAYSCPPASSISYTGPASGSSPVVHFSNSPTAGAYP